MISQTSPNPYAPLKIPEFRNFIAGRFVFIMGLRMTGTVIGWWMYLLTNSKLALGFVGLSEVIPALSLALYAGHRIDRTEKRQLLLKCIILYAFCTLLLIGLSANYTSQNVDPWTIALLMCFVIAGTGAIRAFSGPTFSAMLSQIVPREMLATSASISSATWLTASIIGHAAGGFAIAAMGINGTFILILAFICIGYFLLSRLLPKPIFASNATRTWQSVREGIDFVMKTKVMLGAITLDLFAVLFGGAVALIPVFAKDILHIGPIGFGWLNAAADIGSIMMVTFLTIRPLKRNQGRILLYAIAAFGVCIILFALSDVFWLSFLALLLSGCMDGISVIVRSTIFQLYTPHLYDRRGDVYLLND